jgi:GNAT superfamily N-acetyltransferase
MVRDETPAGAAVSDVLEIRPATETDVSLIRSFIAELGEYERLTSEVVVTEELLRRNLFGPKAYAEALIATWSGEAAGFAVFFHNFSTFLGKPGIYLEDLFVRPHLRGYGIGRALLERIARLAVERDCGRLEWSVLDWNEPAIGFYRKLGAVPKAEWTIFRLTGDALRELGS